MKPSSSPPRARRSAGPIAARSTTRRRRRWAATRSRRRCKRAGVDPAEIDDVIMGAALQQGAQGFNVARQARLRAGLPTSVAGMSLDRQCASGLMAIATAAKEIIDDGMQRRDRRRARIDLAGAERQDEPLPRAGPLARRASRRPLHDDDRDRRDRRRALRGHARARRTNTRCARSSAPPRRSRPAASTTRSCRCPP